jgi:acetylornithine deacetylase
MTTLDRLDAVELLRELVRIPSESGREDAIAGRLEALFVDLRWKPVRSGRNLHVMLGSSGPLLLLGSHTDTVPAGEGWTHAPLGAELHDGRVWGRGSNDAKGCLTAMIVALARTCRDGGLPGPGRVCLAATCEEEIAGAGLERLIRELPRPDAAVVGEPTALQPAVAQRGLVLLELTAQGRSAHVAWGNGINAIEIAARDVLALSELRFAREHPVLGRTTLHVTQVAGGTRHNVVPDRCQLVVDIRTTPAYTPEEIVTEVRNVVQSEVRVRSQRLRPVATEATAPIVRAALQAQPGSRPYGSATLSDWVFLDGIPTVKVGPGDSRRSHTPDEYLEVHELEAGVGFYERLMHAYFGWNGTGST